MRLEGKTDIRPEQEHSLATAPGRAIRGQAMIARPENAYG